MDATTKKKLQDLIDKMDTFINVGTGDREQRPLMARLLKIVAEDQAESAAKMERFTFWLIVLTIVLIVVGVGQVVLMLCGHQ
jgi:hypothetical protein